MAYTPVVTKAIGDPLTAAEWNQYIRDNLALSVPDIMTAKGQIPVGTGVDGVTVLGTGTDFQILQSRAGSALAIEYSNYVGAGISFTTKSLTTGAATIINTGSGTAAWDSLGFYSNATPDRLTIPAVLSGPRLYLISFYGFFDTAAGVANDLLQIRLTKNASASIVGESKYAIGPSRPVQFSITAYAMLSAGDYLGAELLEYMGVNVNFQNGFLSLMLVR